MLISGAIILNSRNLQIFETKARQKYTRPCPPFGLAEVNNRVFGSALIKDVSFLCIFVQR